MTPQEAYEKRMLNRRRKNRVGIKITIDPVIKKARLLELQADEVRHIDRSEIKLAAWRRKNKKS